jgi:hypothetical protein
MAQVISPDEGEVTTSTIETDVMRTDFPPPIEIHSDTAMAQEYVLLVSMPFRHMHEWLLPQYSIEYLKKPPVLMTKRHPRISMINFFGGFESS